MSEQAKKTLYERLGGYDAISAVCAELIGRLRANAQLARFWAHRGDDGIAREKQLLVDFLCSAAGGPMYYTGRDNKLSHKGMRISASDWSVFTGILQGVLDDFEVPGPEQDDVLGFIQSTRADIVEVE
jgi:hemoglobin